MSSLVARIMLAILMIPLAVIAYIVVLVFSFEIVNIDERVGFWMATLITGSLVVGYWTALWRRTVHWSRGRVVGTLLTGGAAVIIGLLIGAVGVTIDWTFGIFIGGTSAVVSWLVMSTLLWRETTAERSERFRRQGGETVACPACGYNLTGLRQTACPECGARYTLEELFASQPQREAGELEG